MRVQIDSDKVKKQRGFTLLELLLVLAIVAALAVSGLAMYQIQLRNFKVDKTALQMQQWLQAGMAFYNDCRQWPATSSSTSYADPNIIPAMMGETALTAKECPKYAGQIRAYMPSGSDISPWSGNAYQIYPNDPDPAAGTLFQVRLAIGGIPAEQAKTIISMIAGRLPNAQTFLPYMVVGIVNRPGQASNDAGKIKILGIETVGSWTNSHIKRPTQADCPLGTEPQIFTAISSFEGVKDPFLNAGIPLPTWSAHSWIDQKDDVKGFLSPRLRTISAVNSNDPPFQTNPVNKVVLITACVPKPLTKTTTGVKTTSSASESNLRY